MQQAFVSAGYDAAYGKVTVSNRPDLCQYQCNGALAAAKAGKVFYTPKGFYKLYRVLAKVVPQGIMARFART